MLCIFILLAVPILAVQDARIIREDTAPGCVEHNDCNCLEITMDAVGQVITYTVDAVTPDTLYTVAFMYKLEDGTADFFIGADDTRPKSLSSTIWKQFSITVNSTDVLEGDEVKLKFRAVDASVELLVDHLQMTPSPKLTQFNDYEYEADCCPWDYCFTGAIGKYADGGVTEEHPECIHDDYYEKSVTMPPIGYEIADFSPAGSELARNYLKGPDGFRCIDGEWKFSRLKFTPLHDGAGYCPYDDQCFFGDDTDHLVENACIEHGTYIEESSGVDTGGVPLRSEWFYCYQGNWTTRTKEIAFKLLHDFTTPDDTYTLFCDSYEFALPTSGTTIDTMGTYIDFVGDDVSSILDSAGVNEFCVLEVNGKIISGVSLNGEIDSVFGEEGECVDGGVQCQIDENACDQGCLIEADNAISEGTGIAGAHKSFIEVLKGPNDMDYCETAILETDGDYHACSGDDIIYNAKLKNVIFSKTTPLAQQVSADTATGSFIGEVFERLLNVIRDLLNIDYLAEKPIDFHQKNLDFIENAGSFDKLYISHFPGSQPAREIRAIRERRATVAEDDDGFVVDYMTFISAMYTNYAVDICGLVGRVIGANPSIQGQITEDGRDLVCNLVILDGGEWMHSIYVENPFSSPNPAYDDVKVWKEYSDSFWNDITAKIRTQDRPPPPDQNPPVPTEPAYITDPTTIVEGGEVYYKLTAPAADDLIAITWDFGDGKKASYHENITPPGFLHIYEEQPTGPLTLCVMNKYFEINCLVGEEPPVVEGTPTVSIEQLTQELDRTLKMSVNIASGYPPYDISVKWNDPLHEERISTRTVEVNEDGVVSPADGFIFEHTYHDSSFPEGWIWITKNVEVSVQDEHVEFETADLMSIQASEETTVRIIPLPQTAAWIARMSITILNGVPPYDVIRFYTDYGGFAAPGENFPLSEDDLSPEVFTYNYYGDFPFGEVGTKTFRVWGEEADGTRFEGTAVLTIASNTPPVVTIAQLDQWEDKTLRLSVDVAGTNVNEGDGNYAVYIDWADPVPGDEQLMTETEDGTFIYEHTYADSNFELGSEEILKDINVRVRDDYFEVSADADDVVISAGTSPLVTIEQRPQIEERTMRISATILNGVPSYSITIDWDGPNSATLSPVSKPSQTADGTFDYEYTYDQSHFYGPVGSHSRASTNIEVSVQDHDGVVFSAQKIIGVDALLPVIDVVQSEPLPARTLEITVDVSYGFTPYDIIIDWADPDHEEPITERPIDFVGLTSTPENPDDLIFTHVYDESHFTSDEPITKTITVGMRNSFFEHEEEFELPVSPVATG
ncbi:hypothetical protein ACFL3V_01790 [Nanoarchaeota archaeon]